MEDRDYVLATDLARLYVLKTILGLMHTGVNPNISKDEMIDVAVMVEKWIRKTQRSLAL